jgi:beta-N-acetylhexosaminidase
MNWFLRLTLILALGCSALSTPATAFAQTSDELVDEIMERMTPEELVGQLVIVTFQGSDIGADHSIYDLIQNYHIGAILLSSENDNFVEAPDTQIQVQLLAQSLQASEYAASFQAEGEGSLSVGEPGQTYIPLFIALRHGGNDVPELLTPVGSQPSQMALGATWDPDYAREIGVLVGQELSAMGINMVLGPSLDIREGPGLTGNNNIGTGAFGGDPYWVGQMGKAYVTGLHRGADQHIAVIATHFPGLGSADRSVQVEVPTIRRTLSQLVINELVPFLEVTEDAPGDESVVDGMLVTHIRYQGMEGAIYNNTRPVSLDSSLMSSLLSSDGISSWRANDGIMISDSLGSDAIRQDYDPTEANFQPNLIVRDALQAGNDMLLLDDFFTIRADDASVVQEVLDFLTEKYVDDQLFADRVDNSVRRILLLKLRVFGNRFDESDVRPAGDAYPDPTVYSDLLTEIAGAAATLISPGAAEVSERLSRPPRATERIVFITDIRAVRQCSVCSRVPLLPLEGLEDAVLRLYGIGLGGTTGEVAGWLVESYSMADLANTLGNPPPGFSPDVLAPAEEVEQALERADWIIFSVLDDNTEIYGADALTLLLNRRPDLVSEVRLVVFAYDVPNVLDATNLSKVDAFYSLYATGEEFIEIAARLLFQEVEPEGASPIDVLAASYDLIEVTSPDPEQIISLRPLGEDEPGDQVETPVEYMIGDVLRVATNVIVDHNGNPVPDFTIVQFIIQTNGTTVIDEVPTTNGIALFSQTLDQLGMITITAQSGDAINSDTLHLNVQEGVPIVPELITPTLPPTPDIAATPVAKAMLVMLLNPKSARLATLQAMDVLDWLLGMFGVLVAGTAGYYLSGRSRTTRRRQVRCTLVGILCGLIGYNYLAFQLPGSERLYTLISPFAGFAMALVGGLAGIILAFTWVFDPLKLRTAWSALRSGKE